MRMIYYGCAFRLAPIQQQHNEKELIVNQQPGPKVETLLLLDFFRICFKQREYTSLSIYWFWCVEKLYFTARYTYYY